MAGRLPGEQGIALETDEYFYTKVGDHHDPQGGCGMLG